MQLRKIFIFFISAILCMAIGQVFYLYTHQQFKPCDFAHTIKKTDNWDVQFGLKDRELALAVVQQPFRYLGEGKQMTAYLSEDERFVIKLFNPRLPLNHKHFSSVKRILRFCSLHWLSNAYFHRQERLERLFKRYQIAATALRDETGTVWVHLQPSTALGKTVRILDRDGTPYDVSLDTIPFVIQYKADLAGERLRQLLDRGDSEKVRDAALQISAFFTQRAHKGYTDRIQTLHNNYGFVGEQFVQIDPGRLLFDQGVAENSEKEVERILSYIRQDWPQLGL